MEYTGLFLLFLSAIVFFPSLSTAFVEEKTEMKEFRHALGSGEFSEEQRARAEEAHDLLDPLQGMQSIKALDIWESLEKELPNNLAVSYGLYRAASFELQRSFFADSETLLRLKAAAARAENTICAAVAVQSDNAAVDIIYARMLCTKWALTYLKEVNLQKPTSSLLSSSLPESDALLDPMLDAFAKARSSVIKEEKFEPALRQAICNALQTVCDRLFSRLPGISATLADSLLGLKFEPKPVTENFEQLYNEAKALGTAAGRVKNKEAAERCRRKAMERYRQLVRLENVPLTYSKGPFTDITDNIYTSALLDAMSFFVDHAHEEADPAGRQALIEESLGISRKYLEQKPDSPDYWEGGYGLAWHYMALAEATLYKDKKAVYAELARKRLVYNTSFGAEHPATAFWTGILEDFDNRTLKLLLSNGQD